MGADGMRVSSAIQSQLAESPRTASFLTPAERLWLQDRQDVARKSLQDKGSDAPAMGATPYASGLESKTLKHPCKVLANSAEDCVPGTDVKPKPKP